MKKNFITYLFIILFIPCIMFAQNGIIKSYYPDHKVKSEQSYVNDILDGPSVWYYPNGKVMSEKNFSRGILNGWVREYFDDGKLKLEYYVINGIKDGNQKKYYADGTLAEILTYNEGMLINQQIFDAIVPTSIENQTVTSENKIVQQFHSPNKNDIKIVSPITSNEKHEEVFTQASIIGGIFSVIEKIVYPDDAVKYGLEGNVIIRATIDAYGNAIKTEVVKGLGLGCDESAEKAVKQSKYLAATKNGKPVESLLLIDVPFKLPAKKQEISKEDSKQAELPKQVRKYEENLSVMCEADRCPRPEDDIATIYSLFQVPNIAKALKLRGMILIEGIVDKSGTFSQTKIIDGVGYGCDQLVEAALQKTKFIPGLKKGEKVETKVLINFPFSYDR